MSDASCPIPLCSPPPSPREDADFAGLVDQFYQPLHRFALGLARNSCQASDLTQQTFYLWVLRGHQLRDRQKAKGWLYTTLYREFLREVRRKTCAAEVEFDEHFAGVPTVAPGGAATVDGAAALRALQRVAEPFRAPLLLFYLEEFSYGEIARALGIPLGTVMSRLSRGRNELRARFHGGGELPARTASEALLPPRGPGVSAAGSSGWLSPSSPL